MTPLVAALKKAIREPLFHFLLLGAALFAVFGWRNGRFESGSKRIVVTQGRIESLANTFTNTYMRPPSERELDGLVREYVREEAAVREATALGLDRDDQIVRRRLRQKLEFVEQGFTAPPEPTDSALQAYLTAHTAQYAAERRISFRQIYLDPARRGAAIDADARRILVELKRSGRKADPTKFGDASVLRSTYEQVSSRDVAFDFGEDFAASLGDLPIGEWRGPVRSTYGEHLVLLTARSEGGAPTLATVREAVRRDWISAQQNAARDQFYDALLKQYTVTIEVPRAGRSATDSVGARK